MLIRTITAVVGIAILIPIVIFSDTILFPIAVSFFITVAIFEILRCIGIHKSIVLTAPFYIFGASAPFAVRYLTGDFGYIEAAILSIMFLVIYILTITVFSKNKTSFADSSTAFFSVIYISFAFAGLVFLRDFENDYIYLLVFVGSWVTDIFAYLTGMLFGKHKLIPQISPKKTVEGSIGGIVFATAAFTLTAWLIGLESIGILPLIIFGIIVSCVSQLGDLCMSAIKRQYGIKDYGKLFPGHGGVLDRFDSILAVSTVMTILFAVLNALHLA